LPRLALQEKIFLSLEKYSARSEKYFAQAPKVLRWALEYLFKMAGGLAMAALRCRGSALLREPAYCDHHLDLGHA
jgi:hypothetical protein